MYGLTDFGFELDPKWIFPELADGQKQHWRNKIIRQYSITLIPILFVLASCVYIAWFKDPGYYAIAAIAAFAGTLFLVGYTRQKTLKLREAAWQNLAVKKIVADENGIDTTLCNLAYLMVSVSGYPTTATGKEKLEAHFRKCSQCGQPGAFTHGLLSGVSLTKEIKEELAKHFGACEFK
ncbi:MAG TPA: hypothetical protein P5080_05155 [Candidatus Paceibacterota bacterium]|nr:hypothetical protein [Candidatus Pacearchaeota archaeon]HRZ51335.1 hypothetical protein [Candidatus Paceibacterota bacterium]HSA37057.1 hypothetical protein [Candidatus Paceibacterota bacterium]